MFKKKSRDKPKRSKKMMIRAQDPISNYRFGFDI